MSTPDDHHGHSPSTHGPDDAGTVPALAFWGILLGLVFPIGGALCAIVLFARSQIGPALAVLTACAVGAVVFLAVAGG